MGKSLPAAIEAGFNRAWNSILDSNVSSLITAMILFLFGSSVIRGFGLVLIVGVLVSMFTAITVTRSVLRVVVAAAVGPEGVPVRRDRGRVPGPPDDRPRLFEARRAGVFDVIGKRRWFFALLLLITIPGLLFLIARLRQPEGGPAVRHRLHGRHRLDDPVRGPGRQPRAGARGARGAGDRGQRHPDRPGVHRDPDQGGGARRPGADADADPERRCRRVAVGLAGRVGVGSALRRRRPRRRRLGLARRVRLAGASASPAPSGSAAPSASAGAVAPRPSAAPGSGGALPTQGKLGEARFALEAALGPDRRAAVAVVGRRRRLERPHHPGAGADPRRLDRDPALDHVPLPRLPDGHDGPGRAAPRRAGRGRRVRDPRDVRSGCRSTACS